MLWRDAYLLQLFPKVALYTGLIWDGRSLHRMKQSDRASPYFGFHRTKQQSFDVLRFYETEWHSFAVFWFSRNKATKLRLEFMSWGRLSGTHPVVTDQSKATWNARQRIKLSSTLPRDPKTSSGAPQELNKAPAFWQYQFLQRATHLDQPKSVSPGQVTFLKNSRCNKLLGISAKLCNTYNAIPEPGYIVRQSLLSFISDSWPRGGRLPEREPSQLVLDQVLILACKAAPIYTQFWPISLSWDWRTSVV